MISSMFKYSGAIFFDAFAVEFFKTDTYRVEVGAAIPLLLYHYFVIKHER